MLKFQFSIILIILFLILLIDAGDAAIVKGTIYGPDLEILQNAIIEVNTTPKQFYVAKDGTYTFNLPPGNYSIKAKYYQHSKLKYLDEEFVYVSGNGEFIVDFILLPPEEEILKDYPISVTDEDFIIEEESNPTFTLTLSAVILISIVLVYLTSAYIKKHKKISTLPEDSEKVLEIIISKGGETTQKELRELLTFSEAKVSLILKELEKNRLIKKVKKGRTNVLMLTNNGEKYILKKKNV